MEQVRPRPRQRSRSPEQLRGTTPPLMLAAGYRYQPRLASATAKVLGQMDACAKVSLVCATSAVIWSTRASTEANFSWPLSRATSSTVPTSS